MSYCLIALFIFLAACTGKSGQKKERDLFAFPDFEPHLIDSPENPYQVKVCDINQDGLPDVIGLSTEPTLLAWYENPTWEKHVITEKTVNNIDVAARDITGDGFPDLALASNFKLSETFRDGQVQWLKNPGITGGNWEVHDIAVSPMAHRVLWADIDGDGQVELINAPIVGKGDAPPHYDIPPGLYWYTVPEDPTSPWKEGLIDADLTLVHGITVVDWNDDGRDDLLTASREGIHLFRYQSEGKWNREKLHEGHKDTMTRSGSSDITVGRMYGKKFLACIDPWHGHELAVYTKENGWKRGVIDDQLVDGHALAVADLDLDGNDEIIAGYRKGDMSLYCYKCVDPGTDTWQKIAVDVGRMSAANVRAADLDGDGYPDLVAAGAITNQIKWYRSVVVRETQRGEEKEYSPDPTL